MSRWYKMARDSNGNLVITFQPAPDRYWPTAVMRQQPLAVADITGHTVVLTGSGAVWMYAHAAAVCRKAGARAIEIQTPHPPGTHDDMTGSHVLLHTANTNGSPDEKAVLLVVQLRPEPPLSPTTIEQLLAPSLEELWQLRPTELILTGQASIAVYQRLATAAIDSGVARLSYCSPREEGLIVVFDRDPAQLGHSLPFPEWVTQVLHPHACPLVIIGVTGDPNRGKSVFSLALDWYRHDCGSGGWRLDCDGQAPTSPWYLSLARQRGETAARPLREQNKRSWTIEMETALVAQLRLARKFCPPLIADLPGGNHKATPPQRIPQDRERLFAEIDALVLLDGEEGDSETAWRNALQPHGLENRLAAVLTSRSPHAKPALTVRHDQNIWRGEVQGLDRSRPASEWGLACKAELETLWNGLLAFAQQRDANR